MYTVQIQNREEVTEITFETYRKAALYYNAKIKELAPHGKRRTALYDIDYKPEKAIRLMRGRFVEEAVEC